MAWVKASGTGSAVSVDTVVSVDSGREGYSSSASRWTPSPRAVCGHGKREGGGGGGGGS